MNHLSDDLLLAYVRRQQLYLWSQSMQEHLAHCLVCQGRCAEFAQLSSTIELWARSSANDPAYGTVGSRVMRQLYEEKLSFSHRIHYGIRRVKVVLPIVVMLVVLCMVLLTVITVHMGGSTAKSTNVPVTPTAYAPVQITPLVDATATPVPTASPTPLPGSSVVLVTATPRSTPTSITSSGQVSIKEDTPCTTVVDAIENILHVCGKNFTPGSTVTIQYQIGSKDKKHVMQVAHNGSFIDSLVVNSCDEVPTAIYVQSSTNPAETAKLTKNIIFGMCQDFGKLRK